MPDMDISERVIQVENKVMQVENRTKTLEDIEKINSEIFTEMKNSLKTIEKLMTGSLENNSIGLIATIQNDQKEIAALRESLNVLKGSFDLLAEEYKKYKWYLRGMGFTLFCIISYGLKAWEIFAPK